MKMSNRRQFPGSGAALAAISPTFLLSSRIAVVQVPKLDPNDAQAKALSYVPAASGTGRVCANCQLYTGAADSEWGPCAIFPGKQVAADGWCSAWVE